MKHLAGLAVCLFFIAGSGASAQNGVNDKDIQIMMSNLKSDTGRFRSAFNESVKKTTIRHTSREKESKNLVTNFKGQVDGTYQTFKAQRKRTPTYP